MLECIVTLNLSRQLLLDIGRFMPLLFVCSKLPILTPCIALNISGVSYHAVGELFTVYHLPANLLPITPADMRTLGVGLFLYFRVVCSVYVCFSVLRSSTICLGVIVCCTIRTTLSALLRVIMNTCFSLFPHDTFCTMHMFV